MKLIVTRKTIYRTEQRQIEIEIERENFDTTVEFYS